MVQPAISRQGSGNGLLQLVILQRDQDLYGANIPSGPD
jgi:hypothetical protein